MFRGAASPRLAGGSTHNTRPTLRALLTWPAPADARIGEGVRLEVAEYACQLEEQRPSFGAKVCRQGMVGDHEWLKLSKHFN